MQNNNVDPNYFKFYLPNGIKCVLYQRSEIHSVSFRINVNVGSLDEDDNTNGISHFIEHVVHDGTKDLTTWDEVEKFKTEYSASTNAYTSNDHTRYYGTFPYQYFEQGLYFFSQIVLNPLFNESDVNKEREIIIDEMKSYEDEIDYKIIRNIKENRFTTSSTPYSYEVIGTKELLKKLNPEDLINFWEKHYVPENIEIYILGNFNLEKAKELLKKYFVEPTKAIKKTPKPEREFKKKYPNYSGFRIDAKKKLDLDKYYLTFTFPDYEFKFVDANKRYRMSFVKAITASSSYFQSVLWKKLRQELGIVYGVSAWNYDMYARDFLGIDTSFNKEHLETVITEIYNGINQIKEGNINDVVFKAKQKKTLDTQLMILDDPANGINWIASYEDEIDEHGKGMKVSEYLDYVKEIKFEDVLESAKEVYDWSRVNIGIVGNEEENEMVQKVKDIWDKVNK